MAKPKKKKSGIPFKERLNILIGDDKPYSWCKKAGIDKGLFQYYWQKGKVPKYDNLIKIRDLTGCSLDWLVTGNGEPFVNSIESSLAINAGIISELGNQIKELQKHVKELVLLRVECKKNNI